MDIHLRDLRYAVAVADELNVTAAAQRLYIAQPTVSKQVRALERQVGFEIFVRRPGGVSLTPAGEVLIARARILLADWSDGLRAAQAAAAPGVLRIGLQTAVGRGVVAELTEVLDPERWQISVRLVPWTDPTAGLVDGATDLGLLWEPVPDGVTTLRVLREEPRSVIVGANHRLAGRVVVDFAEIADDPVIALPATAGVVRDYWLAADRRSVAARIAAEAENADETFEAVNAGLGIAIIAQGNGELYRRSEVAAIPIRDLEPARLVLCTATRVSGNAEAYLAAFPGRVT